MFDDDRPIKPDKKYVEEYQLKLKQQRLKPKQYLVKNKQSILPCHKQNIQNKKQRSQSPKSKRKTKTKAEIYDEIKKTNRQKFGEWDKNKKPDKHQDVDKNKKLKPHQMTVNYRPKTVNIDTRQYKKPDYKEQKKFITKKSLIQEKKQYQRMLQYMKKVFNEFQIQKQAFEKEKEYLKFRKIIEQQPGIVIQTNTIKPKSRVRNNLIKNTQSQKNIKMNIKQEPKKPNQKIFNQNFKNIPDQNQQQEPNDDTVVRKFEYPLQKLYECHPFNLKQIYKYANKSQFIPENGQLYNKAKNIIQTQRSTGKVQTIKPKCTHGSIGSNHVTCSEQSCAQKRITKFAQGWYQLWIAGRYRTVYNKQLGYKVVWYNNGDIKQQFSNGKVQAYDCKDKKVIQIKVDKQSPFWYFPYINQLQMKDPKGNTQIIFSDGRHQIIVNQQS